MRQAPNSWSRRSFAHHSSPQTHGPSFSGKLNGLGGHSASGSSALGDDRRADDGLRPQRRAEVSRGGGGNRAIQPGGLKPERRHPRDAVCGPRIAESDAHFGGAVVTPIWGSCGTALSATAGAPAGRSGASSRGCRHRVPGQGAGGRQRRGRRPGRPGTAGCPRGRSRPRSGGQRCGLQAREATGLRGDGLRQV
jgi:hypothetical protein